MIQTGRARRFTIVPEKKIERSRDTTPKDVPPAEHIDTYE